MEDSERAYRKAESDRRLKPVTRDSRKEEALIRREACVQEFKRRQFAKKRAERKLTLQRCLFHLRVRSSNVIEFPGK